MEKVFKALEDLFDLIRSQGSFEKAQKCYDILDEAITELAQIKNKFDEDRKSDITNLSYKEFKEIHKDDTPEDAVDILHRLSLVPDYVKPNSVEVWARRFLRDKVDQALAELKAIKEAKPSEAMKELNLIKDWIEAREIENSSVIMSCFPIIEQALLDAQESERLLDHERELNDHLILKSQEIEKGLEIILKKNVDIDMIKNYQTVIEYNWNIRFDRYKRKELTEEEFDLLKKLLKKYQKEGITND